MEAIKKLHIDMKNEEHEEQRIKIIEQDSEGLVGDSRGKIDFENSKWENENEGVGSNGIAWIDKFINGESGISLDNLDTSRFKGNKKDRKLETEVDFMINEIKNEVLQQEEIKSDIPIGLLKAIEEYKGQVEGEYKEKYEAVIKEKEYMKSEDTVDDEVLDVYVRSTGGSEATDQGPTKSVETERSENKENCDEQSESQRLEELLTTMDTKDIKEVLDKLGMELSMKEEKEINEEIVSDKRYEYIYNEEGKLMYKRRRRKQC